MNTLLAVSVTYNVMDIAGSLKGSVDSYLSIGTCLYKSFAKNYSYKVITNRSNLRF